MNLTGRRLRVAQAIISVRDRELPLRPVSDRQPVVQQPAPGPIPLVVHQTHGNGRVGRTHRLAIEEFRALNPEFEFRVATNDMQMDFMRTHYAGEDILRVFEAVQVGVMRADIYRYALLHREGGVYMDLSKRLTQPLMQFLEGGASFVLSHERNRIPDTYPIDVDDRIADPGYLMVQWCLMSAPGHRFLTRVMDNIVRTAWEYDGVVHPVPKTAVLELTATYMWTKSVWDELRADPRQDYILAGFDYDEAVFPLIVGSYASYLFKPHYSNAKDRPVVDSRSLPDPSGRRLA